MIWEHSPVPATMPVQGLSSPSSTYLKALRPARVIDVGLLGPSSSLVPVGQKHLKPVSPDSYLRRPGGMMMSRRGVAISRRALNDRLSRSSRLPLRGRNRLLSRFPVRFLLGQYPVGGLRKMPSHRTQCLLVPLPFADPQVQPIDMPEGRAAMVDGDEISCLNERPLQVSIHIRAKLAIARPSPRGMYPGSGARVGGQARGCRESRYVSDLQQNDRGEDEPHSG